MASNKVFVFVSQINKFFILPCTLFMMAGKLSNKDFGMLMLYFSLATTLSSLLSFGLQHTVIINNRGDISKGYVWKIFQIKFLILLLFSPLLYFLLIKYGVEILNFLIFSIFSSFYVVICSFLRIKDLHKGEFISSTAGTLLLLLSVFVFIDDATVELYSTFLILSRLISLIFGIYIVFENYNSYKFSNFKISQIIKLSLPMFSLTLLATSSVNLDTVLANEWIDIKEISNYQFYFRVMLLSMIFSEVINAIYLHKIVAYVRDNNKDLLYKAIKEIFYAISFISIFCFVFYLFTIDFFVDFLFSNKFSISNEIKVIISIVMILRLMGILPSIILLTFRELWIRVFALLVSIISGLLAIYIFSNDYGVTSIAYGALISHIVLNLIYIIKAKKVLNAYKL